jgi:hypothetical protein
MLKLFNEFGFKVKKSGHDPAVAAATLPLGA